MRYAKCLNVDRDRLEQMELKLQSCDPELPPDEAIFDEGMVVRLDRGYTMMIQVVAPNSPEDEPCWSQAVLLDKDGRELAVTEPSESLRGEWIIGYRTDEYSLIVMSKGAEMPEPRRMTIAEDVGWTFGDYCGGWVPIDAHTIAVKTQSGSYARLSVEEMTKEEWDEIG